MAQGGKGPRPKVKNAWSKSHVAGEEIESKLMQHNKNEGQNLMACNVGLRAQEISS